MDTEEVSSFLKRNKKLISASAGILSLYTVVQLFLLQTNMHGYDSFRDLSIVKEIAVRGTFSYFGQGYAVNPPLSYLMRAGVASLTGFNLFSQKAFSIMMFFAGQLLVYLSARNFWDKRRSFYVFLVSSLSWSFVLATRIRSFAYMMLFSGLIFYSYTRYLNESSLQNAVLVGVSLGIGMLAKSSFAFLVIILSLHHGFRWLKEGTNTDIIHYGVFGGAAFALYVPYLAYLGLNGHPMPWAAQAMSITGEAAWMQNFTPESHIFLYRRLFEMYPVMSLLTFGGIISFREKIKKKLFGPLGFIALVVLLGPIMGRLVLAKVHVYQLFFLFIPLPFFSLWTVERILERFDLSHEKLDSIKQLNGAKILVILLVLASSLYGVSKIDQKTTPQGNYFPDSMIQFTENLEEDEVVLSEKGYIRLHALSDGYVENSGEISARRLQAYSADYYISSQNLSKNYLDKRQEIIIADEETNVYKVQSSKLPGSANTTEASFELESNGGRPVSYARCVVAGQNWRQTKISDASGQVTFQMPETSRGAIVGCQALGYREFQKGVDGRTIKVGELKPIIHRYKKTRY
jgi:hypothetical protein